MDDFDLFERSLAAALRSDADQSLAQFEPATVARAAMADTQRGTLSLPWNTVRPTSNRWALAVAAVIGVLLVGGAFFLFQRGQPSIGGPSPTTSADPSPSEAAAVSPSAGPTATPSPTPTPLLWTEASLEEDWPAPVRPEPVGEAILVPFSSRSGIGISVPDPLGDTGSDDHPWVDIRVLEGSGAKVFIELVDNHPPLVDPTEQWIAYGVVVDADRDGVPDWRYGIDNMPVDATGERPHRAWRTYLHTGRMESAPGAPYGGVGDTYFDTFYPPGGNGPEGARLAFGGDLAGGGTDPGLVDPFYAWASVIVDGRVVATDYAPDFGWLDPNLR